MTALGAAFDMETDAFLILVLSVYVVPVVGAWVLLIGLARYLLLVATALRPWLGAPVPPRRWAKVVAAVQGIALVVVAVRGAADAARPGPARRGPGPARRVVRPARCAPLRRTPSRAPSRPGPAGPRRSLDVLAVGLLWLVLALPSAPRPACRLRALAAIPVELLVFVALSLVLPRRLGARARGASAA